MKIVYLSIADSDWVEKMELMEFKVGHMECASYVESEPECVIIQLAGELKKESLVKEIGLIKERADKSFIIVFCKVADWNSELSPWNATPVFGNEPFGAGAGETLSFIENQLIPEIFEANNLEKDCPIILVGYSLAGLFALWSSYRTERYFAIAAVSPSVWFPGWIEYAENNVPYTDKIYLSLGDKEEKTKNKLMKEVGKCICRQKEIFDNRGITDILEWNEGNHFRDVEQRCAKGVAWCIGKLS